MIKSRVVFVLGAGASKPYGYPSGPELVGNMLGLQADVVKIIEAHGYTQKQWGPFQDALKKSAQSSIDAFLERRSDMRELGKLLIASYILRCENEGPFYNTEDHWYPMLVDKLDDPFDNLDFSNTTIVTFNYDRSLEQFLFQCLCNRHNKGADEVARLLSRLRIIHVYGHVGPLDWQVTGGRTYSPELIPSEVRIAAEGIKIISEGRDDSAELTEARELISGAKTMIYLGMAYHPDNMRRLGLLRQPDKTARATSGSGFRLTHAEREYYHHTYAIDRIGSDNEQSRIFLRNNPDFLRL